MSHVKYTKLPTSDARESDGKIAFDFSSAFSYESTEKSFENRYSSAEQLKSSIFDYPQQHAVKSKIERELRPPSILHQAADWSIVTLAVILILCTSPVSWWFCFKRVKGNQKALVYRLGRKRKLHDSGLMLVIPLLDQVTLIDVGTRAFNIPPQMVSTADRAIVQLGAELQYSVLDAVRSVTATQDSRQYLRGIAQTVLIHHVSSRDLKQVTNDRLGLGYEIQKELNTVASDWGLAVNRLELSHVQVLQEPDPEPSGIQALLSRAHVATPPGMPGFPELMSQVISSPHMQQVMSALGKKEAGAQPGMKQVMEAWSRAAEQQFAPEKPEEDTEEAVKTVEGSEPSSGRCTLDDLIGLLKDHVTPERCKSVNACINLVVLTETETSSLYHVDMRPECPSIGSGHLEAADSSLRLSATDLAALVSGQLSATSAYFGGQLQVSGSLQAAISIGSAISDIWENCVLRSISQTAS